MDENKKNENPLLAAFPDSSDLDARLSAFDWEEFGVSNPYIIFITGRCGSTLLANMIKDTQLAGSPDEYFNEQVMAHHNKEFQARTFADYLHEAVKSSSSNGRFGSQIDWYRLRRLENLVDFPAVFPRDRSTFFYMTRRDIVAQAWSYATAKATGVWHQFADKRATAVPLERPVLSDERIWREIILLLEAEVQMERFFDRHAIAPIRIDYEMLTSSRRDVLAAVLLNVGCEIDAIVATAGQIVDRTNKMPNDSFAEMLAFRKKYAGLLVDVDKVRGSSYAAVEQSLRQANVLQ